MPGGAGSAADNVPAIPKMARRTGKRSQKRSKASRVAFARGAARGRPWRPSQKMYGGLKIPITVYGRKPS